MKRIILTDCTGKWFNSDKAIKLEESTRWNGNNHISRETGSQWDHVWLWLTAGGTWVLNAWSQYQGSLETYEQIGESEALKFIVRNNCTVDELRDTIRKSVDIARSNMEL